MRSSFDDQFSHPDSKVGTMETFSVAFVALVTLCSASSGEFIFLNFPFLKNISVDIFFDIYLTTLGPEHKIRRLLTWYSLSDLLFKTLSSLPRFKLRSDQVETANTPGI